MVYHDVVRNDFKYNHEHYNYNTTIKVNDFEKQIKYLSRHYTLISLEDFIDWKTSKKTLPDNPLLITFDDGHSNLYHNAIPILNKYNIKGVFFVKSRSFGLTEQNYCEQFLSNFNSYKEGKTEYNLFRSANYQEQIKMIGNLSKHTKYDSTTAEKYEHLTVDQCIDIINHGHTIQSHSVNHFIMSALSDLMAEIEVRESKSTLENLFHKTVTCFAYPFGDPKYDYTSRDKDLLKKYGYTCGFSGEQHDPNGVTMHADNYSISRFGDVNHDLLYFKLLLSPIRLFK